MPLAALESEMLPLEIRARRLIFGCTRAFVDTWQVDRLFARGAGVLRFSFDIGVSLRL
jgi:hypothetical protein